MIQEFQICIYLISDMNISESLIRRKTHGYGYIRDICNRNVPKMSQYTQIPLSIYIYEIYIVHFGNFVDPDMYISEM